MRLETRKHTHCFGWRYKFSTFRCWKKPVNPTRLYAKCASSPMTVTSSSLLFASSLINFSLQPISHCPSHTRPESNTHTKLIPTIPKPTTTTTTLFLAPPPLTPLPMRPKRWTDSLLDHPVESLSPVHPSQDACTASCLTQENHTSRSLQAEDGSSLSTRA